MGRQSADFRGFGGYQSAYPNLSGSAKMGDGKSMHIIAAPVRFGIASRHFQWPVRSSAGRGAEGDCCIRRRSVPVHGRGRGWSGLCDGLSGGVWIRDSRGSLAGLRLQRPDDTATSAALRGGWDGCARDAQRMATGAPSDSGQAAIENRADACRGAQQPGDRQTPWRNRGSDSKAGWPVPWGRCADIAPPIV